MRTLADLFKALSDETRLNMMALLVRWRELCVCDFVEVLGITQSKASRHLRYLLNAGLLQDRREGVWVMYRFHERPGPDAAAVLAAMAPVLESRDLGPLEARLQQWRSEKDGSVSPCNPPWVGPDPDASLVTSGPSGRKSARNPISANR
jgi:ArsR family transcriptional regulator